ncbi:MAG: four helix bundle protein [Pyrinomonadaceae bacterium]
MSDISLKAKVQIKSHRDLVVWQKAMDLVEAIYTASRTFPKDETYGLVSQMRRAAVSIPANVAEGQGRRLPGEFQQFLANARGSLWELDTHLELALRLKYINSEQYNVVRVKLDEVGRLLNGLLRSIASNI